MVVSKSEFQRIARMARARWGLSLTEKKLQLVNNRLTSFLRTSEFNSVADYLTHLETDASDAELLVFFDLLSTNVTSFYRERAHFDYLEREFFTPLSRNAVTRPDRKLRLWSAACSMGPEPYTMAIHALEHLTNLSTWDFKILATDLSNSAVKAARKAVYAGKMVDQLDPLLVKKYFTRIKNDPEDSVEVTSKVRDLVTVGQLNLLEPWTFKGLFDVIFCRNVMIYFDQETRQELVMKMHDVLRPGGIFVIGSAETLTGLNTPFKSAQPSVYVK